MENLNKNCIDPEDRSLQQYPKLRSLIRNSGKVPQQLKSLHNSTLTLFTSVLVTVGLVQS